ncbi:MAG: rRNA processing protein RimM [Peptostreptococcaceae bacterium]|nr:rRNA processing protein RimM [Peptostreptococcaceae bacterium]
MKSNKLRIGKIVNTHGLKGEVKVYPYTDYPERFKEIQYLYMENSDEKISVENVKISKNMVILKLSSILTIDDAEKNRNNYLFIDRENARKLDEDEHLIADLIGCKVYDISEKYIGLLEDVLQYSANDVYSIKSENGKTYLVPAIKKFVPVIDIDNKKIIIDPIEGMIE